MSMCNENTCPAGFVRITFNQRDICVMADYYKENGIRMPLSYKRAIEIANRNGWKLPTKEIVDAIWQQADLRLTPITMTPDASMTTMPRFIEHNQRIEQQIAGRPFTLVAGHKKDVIAGGAGYVTIYGWHRSNGRPIQQPYSGHDDNYRDYSHGIRYVIY